MDHSQGNVTHYSTKPVYTEQHVSKWGPTAKDGHWLVSTYIHLNKFITILTFGFPHWYYDMHFDHENDRSNDYSSKCCFRNEKE